MHRALLSFVPWLLIATACNRSAPANVAAEVNGRAITFAELDKQLQIIQLSEPASGSPDDKRIQRLELLRVMVDNEIMLQRAERDGLLATDSDVEAKYAELKSPYTEEEWKKQLNDRKMTIEDLKAQLRRDLSVQKLLNKETTAKISITDKDITDFYNANQSSFNRAEPQLHLAQILVTPAGDANIRNLKGDNALDDPTAKRKIDNIAAMLRQGEDFGELAANYSEDPNSAMTGGDLGFIRESDLSQANADLRRAIEALGPGEVTPVLETAEGYRILKLITREPAGQRDLGDPGVQQTIRETLLNRRDQVLKAAFYEVARSEADVRNYLAESIVYEK